MTRRTDPTSTRFPWLQGCTLLLLLALTACGNGDDYLMSSVDPKSDFAVGIHDLYIAVFWWTLGILAVVWGVMAYILIRFKARPGDPIPEQTHGSTALEVAWTIAPAIIVVLITIPTIRGVFETQRPISEDALEVHVLGKRFWWQFHYPELGITTANELHIPVDRPVSLRLESGDVIHSFWIPKLGGKRDVNPVRARPEGKELEYNWLYFTPFEEGMYWGQCAEFCGDSHALMKMRVKVDSQDDFDQWVDDWRVPALTATAPVPDTVDGVVQAVSEDPLIAEGRDVFFNQSFCTACHSMNGTAAGLNSSPIATRVAPDLTRMGQRATIAAGMLENTPENLERWIRNPHAIKPGALMPSVTEEAGGWPATGLTDDQIRALAAYLSSLT